MPQLVGNERCDDALDEAFDGALDDAFAGILEVSFGGALDDILADIIVCQGVRGL